MAFARFLKYFEALETSRHKQKKMGCYTRIAQDSIKFNEKLVNSGDSSEKIGMAQLIEQHNEYSDLPPVEDLSK